MEGKNSQPRALLIFGAPCSGKTTFAEKFAKKFNLAFYNIDELMEKDNLTQEMVFVVLKQVMKTGTTIVIEGGLKTEKDRDEMRGIVKEGGYQPCLIWVQTDFSTIRSRLKKRYKTVAKAKEIYEKAVAELEAPADSEKPIILSGKHTFETQTKHVLAGLANAHR